MRRVIAAVLAAVLLVVLPRAEAHAAGHRIAIVTASDDDPVTQHLRAELATLGFDVVLVRPSEPTATRAGMDAAARDNASAAAIRIVPSTNGVEVWVADRLTGKTVLAEIVRADSSTAADVALRAVELLRASLLELEAKRSDVATRGPSTPLGAPPSPAPSSVDRRPNVRGPRASPPSVANRGRGSSAPARTEPGFVVELGPGLVWTPSAIDSAAGVRVGLRWMPTQLGAALSYVQQIGPITLDSPKGTLDITAKILTGGVALELAPPRATLVPRLGLGIATAFIHVDGHPDVWGRPGRSNDIVDLAMYAEGSVSVPVAERTRLALGMVLGSTLHRPVLSLAETEIAVWGRPLVLPWLGIEFDSGSRSTVSRGEAHP